MMYVPILNIIRILIVLWLYWRKINTIFNRI
jgi:hypothetical protein